MNEMNMAFTAVFLELNGEYIFHRGTAGNERSRPQRQRGLLLYELAAEVFDDERRNVDEMLRGKAVFRRR